MIDLRNKELPNAIKVDGNSFLIKTDFREWLKIGEILNRELVYYSDLEFIFKNNIPNTDYYEEIVQFYYNPNSTPTAQAEDNNPTRLFDYIEDGEYIVASFMKDYGINLTDPNLKMHWHLFKALFNGLSKHTKMKEIIEIRGYSDKKITESDVKRYRDSWKLPDKFRDTRIDDINDLFYNC